MQVDDLGAALDVLINDLVVFHFQGAVLELVALDLELMGMLDLGEQFSETHGERGEDGRSPLVVGDRFHRRGRGIFYHGDGRRGRKNNNRIILFCLVVCFSGAFVLLFFSLVSRRLGGRLGSARSGVGDAGVTAWGGRFRRGRMLKRLAVAIVRGN
jgi:hypothetical protein